MIPFDNRISSCYKKLKINSTDINYELHKNYEQSKYKTKNDNTQKKSSRICKKIMIHV